MHAARLRLKNVGPFAGEHTIDLKPMAYAVTATRDDDPEKSNGAGKTTFVSAIRLALYGAHWARLEDGWITHGESVGEDELTMSDGSRILRSRHRGKPTRLYFWAPGAPADKPATQAEAQRLIEERVGLSQSDFDATCFFEQKRMSRMVVATPEERMQIVAGWLALAPLQRAEDACRARLARVSADADAVSKSHASLVDERARILGVSDHTVHEKLIEFRIRCDTTGKMVAMLKAKRDDAAATLRAASEKASAIAAAEAIDDLVNRGRELAAKVAEGGADAATLHAKLDDAKERHSAARRRANELHVVASGEFDGKCPIASMQCPAREKINSMRTKSAAAWEKADAAAQARYADVQAIEGEYLAADTRERKLERMRGEVKGLQREAKKVEGLTREQVDAELQHARAADAKAEAEWVGAREELARLDADVKRLATIEEELVKLEDLARAHSLVLATHQEAMIIFGKNGAQRRVAESALGRIEQSANDELEAAGIDLRISVLWSREGQGLASSCDACGSPFPSSVRVKQCVRCGADRGPKIVNRLEIEPSSRSGGLDDLAGIYFQLAASSWLRQARGCQWASAVIDEPTGALDRAAQRAVGRHVATTLAGLGFAQSLVIAHHPGVLDMLPGRIEVTSRGGRASVRVVA